MLNWYAATLANLHIDNHSDIIARFMSTEDLADLLRGLDVDVVQVSALGNQGTKLTFPSKRLPHLVHPELGDYDMIERFRDATLAAGKRFFIYINTRGLRLDAEHPDWVQRDANGHGSRFRGGNDMCARPTPDGRGFLELELLPLLAELTERYEPDGFWVDGDHARIPACYCDNCREAFRRAAGRDAPVSAEEEAYDEWMAFQLTRRDEYKMMMADAVHRIRPETLYCSNHSFRNTYTAAPRNIDPRSAPDWIGYLSADLSHGDAIRQTRIMAMSLSPEEETAHDIMHLVSSRVPRRRFLQQGALTIASGSPWFLWGGHTFVDSPEDRANVRTCLEFVNRRRRLLMPETSRAAHEADKDLPLSTSANPVAVLASESIWRNRWASGDHRREAERANSVACGLQDAAYPVDLVNERILRARCGAGRPMLRDTETDRFPYRVLVLPDRAELLPETIEVVDELASAGTVLVDLPASTIPEPDWDGEAAALLAASGVGPALLTRGTDRHLVFTLRARGKSLLLSVADITSFREGARVLPSTREDIDDEDRTHRFTLSLAVAEEPTGIATLPESTSAAMRYSDRRLDLDVTGFDIHAIIELQGVETTHLQLFDVKVPVTSSLRGYPRELRTSQTAQTGVEHGHIV